MKKQQFNINNLLSVLIIFTICAIFYMLYEDKINSYFIKEPVVTPKETPSEVAPPKKMEETPYNSSWYFNNAEQYTKYRLTAQYSVNVHEPLIKLRIKIPVAQNQKNLQYVFNIDSNLQVSKIFMDGDNKFIEYIIENVEPKKYTFYITHEVAVKKYDINIAKKINLNLRPGVNLDRYLQQEKDINVNSEYLNQVANTISGNTKEEIVRNIFDYIQENVEYNLSSNILDAEEVLKKKKAVCGGFSSLMVALCRIKNIPARIVYGNAVVSGKMSKHSWVEVYYSEYGWVTYDPTSFIVNQQGKKLSQKERIKTPKIDYFTLGYNGSESWYTEAESNKPMVKPFTLDYYFEVEKI